MRSANVVLYCKIVIKSSDFCTRKRCGSIFYAASQEEESYGVEITIFIFDLFCRAYGGFVGWSVIATIVISISLMQATRNGSDVWLTHWVDNVDDAGGQSLQFYLVSSSSLYSFCFVAVCELFCMLVCNVQV